MLKSRFESLGCYMPSKVLSSREMLDSMKTKPMFDFVELTGIQRRRCRSDTDDSLQLGLAAAKDCLKRSMYEPQDIEAVIWTSITRFTNVLDFQFEPSMSLCLKNELGATKALNFDITNACAGMLTGVFILDNLIKAGVVKNGLVVSGECITHLTDTAIKEIKDPIDEQFASLTVGDSGAAVVMDRSPGDGEGLDMADILTIAQFSDLCFGMPSEQGPRIAMYTKAVEIHAESVRRLPKFLTAWFTSNPEVIDRYLVKKKPFDFVIPHQTALRVMTSATEEMFDHVRTIDKFESIEMPELLTYIQEFGNTSSTSHFVVLYHALKDKKVKPGDSLILVPHASGIVAGFFLLKVGNLEV